MTKRDRELLDTFLASRTPATFYYDHAPCIEGALRRAGVTEAFNLNRVGAFYVARYLLLSIDLAKEQDL